MVVDATSSIDRRRSRPDSVSVGIGDLHCLTGRDPVATLGVTGEGAVVATVDPGSLRLSVWEPATQEVAEVSGETPAGLYELSDAGQLEAIEGADPVEGAASPFVYGDHIGTVNHETGTISVQ
jgi:hypothetical protein